MIPLHVHSNYSLLNGVASIEDLIKYAGKDGLDSLALTDTNGMYGLIKFAKKCLEEGIKPILGAFIDESENQNINAVLLAKNNEGYSELCKIITARKLNDDFSLIGVVNKKPKNLFIISSSLELLKNINIYDNVYAELISTKSQRINTRKIFEYANTKNIHLVATNPVYFLEHDDYLLHKIMSAVRLNTTVENIDSKDLVDEEYYWKGINELKKIWKSLPDAIKASDFIADNCNVDLEIGTYKYPKFNLLTNEPSNAFLKKEAYKGLRENYFPLTTEATVRLESELEVIEELHLTDYFLIVWDIVREAKRRGMMFIGRGSAANSIVAYCLGLTQVDPIKNKLFFERFLNKGRSSPPDVDIDFSWKERDEIVKYVFDKYGYQNVAMISTTVTFRARSAFREVAKVFGFTNEEISKYSKYIPWTGASNLPNISELFPESKNINFKVEPWKSIVNFASKIANFPRHLSIHPSGIIITPQPVTNFTALEYAKNKGLGLIITQPDMYSIEDLGLIKIDLLSQRSLGVLRDTIDRINLNYNKKA